MKHRLLYLPIAILFILSFVDCAKRGTPSGGLRDSIPPRIVKSNPENYSTLFEGQEIKIYFDEYIKLKDLQKELIISPPPKYAPIITPLNISKQLRITLKDTLKENTTYAFNFGNAIVDNNEENVFPYFKYVFSTGSFIDSLTLKGTVNDALLLNSKKAPTVMLYEVNETYNDSTPYLEKPIFITIAKDSAQSFEFTNLKAGTYKLIALEETSSDYKYQASSEKIGFHESYITLPTDQAFNLVLFNEKAPEKISRGKHVAKNHITFGLEGNPDIESVTVLSDTPSNFKYEAFKSTAKDSLHYWYQPAFKDLDSLLFKIKTKTTIDTVTVRLRDLYADSLTVTRFGNSLLTPNDSLIFKTNTPIETLDIQKIHIQNKDSIEIPVDTFIKKESGSAALTFTRDPDQSYQVTLLPGAITDLFETKNDTLQYSYVTKEESDFGSLNLTIETTESLPLIIQLLNAKFDVVYEKYTLEKAVYFDYINPDKYYIRILVDENKNKKWDSGNFLNKKQPERSIYFPTQLDILANWSLQETFIIE